MARADVITLVQAIANQQADATTVQRFYDDIAYDLAVREIVTNVSLVAVVAGTASIALPTAAIDILAAFYDDRILSIERPMDMAYTNGEQWRDISGPPLAIIREGESARSFTLFPNPDRPSDPSLFIHGAPLGVDFPNESVTLIHTEKRDNLPIWLELPVAFLILEREFNRESDHKDVNFAAACKEMAILLFQMVEVVWPQT